MKKIFSKATILFAIAFALTACGGSTEQGGSEKGEFGLQQLNTNSPDKDQYLMIETDRGNIKIMLYKETPLHRANFVNLVMNKYYDGQLFFRVIKDFMIQAGDPKSRGAAAKIKLGETDVSYKIPAEIDVKKRWHKYGALSAASLNPAVESSGSHFSIITGRKVNDKVLNDHENKYNKTLRRKMYESLQVPYRDKINKLYEESKKSSKKKKELNEMIHFFTEKTDSAMVGKEFKYTPEQRKAYKEEGGAFHLDGYFTVFGEVLEGMDIVENISREKYDVHNRPVKDVVIKRIVLLDE
ncbi:MAG: peptidylprolyl isomerase [Bacteroidaceae bacterium]|nr:peptidylprolyl isomerase [Bacteroidaceae bacterium]